MRDLKFKGALVNGFSQVGTADSAVYYDLPQYRPFWAEVERLGVPFYLHPRYSLPSRRQRYEGHPWLIGSPWDFAEETAIHSLRLMGCGLFDDYPKLQIVIGHLGERIPFDLWRLDHRLSKLPGRPAKRTMAEYFRNNFHITTSGNFCTQSLIHTILTVGADRVLFAVDYPFEDHAQAAEWFDAAEIAEHDRIKIGRDNAKALFALAVTRLSDCLFILRRIRGRGTAIMLRCYGNRAGSRPRRTTMIRTMFAMAVAALVLAAVSGTSQAAPIAPLPAGVRRRRPRAV